MDERDPPGDVIIGSMPGSMRSPIFPQADDRARRAARGHVRSVLKQEEQGCGAAKAPRRKATAKQEQEAGSGRSTDGYLVMITLS